MAGMSLSLGDEEEGIRGPTGLGATELGVTVRVSGLHQARRMAS